MLHSFFLKHELAPLQIFFTEFEAPFKNWVRNEFNHHFLYPWNNYKIRLFQTYITKPNEMLYVPRGKKKKLLGKHIDMKFYCTKNK